MWFGAFSLQGTSFMVLVRAIPFSIAVPTTDPEVPLQLNNYAAQFEEIEYRNSVKSSVYCFGLKTKKY